MSDEDIQTLMRTYAAEHPRVLSALARAGRPRICLFCYHGITGQPTCGNVHQYQLGSWVYAPNSPKGQVPVGRYVGENKIALRGQFSEINDKIHVQPQWIVELPEAWKKTCMCDHSVVPQERTMQEYQERYGVDLRVAQMLRRGDVLYSTAHRNADHTPMRWRVTGARQLWKRSPTRFRMPIKHGMYGKSDTLDQYTCVGFRTTEAWAYSYGELMLKNMSKRSIQLAKAAKDMAAFQAAEGRPR